MKYIPSLMVGQLSGKAGSTVASRNRSGSYFKTKTIPKLVTNPFTEEVRNNLTTISKGWSALSSEQQLSWGSYAAGINRTDSLGLGYTLTGSQAYMLINRNLFSIGSPAVQDPPSGDSPNGLDDLSFVATPTIVKTPTTVTTGAASATQLVGSTSGWAVGDVLTFGTGGPTRTITTVTDGTHVVLDSTITTTTGEDVFAVTPATMVVTFDPDPPEGADFYLIFATAPLSTGVARPTKSAFRLIESLPQGSFASGDDIAAVYQSRFGSVPGSRRIFLSISTVSAEGLKSGALTAQADTA